MINDRKQIADILHAIVVNLRLSDLEKIVEAEQICWKAQANWGMNAQIDAQNDLEKIVIQSIENMSKHSIKQIQEYITIPE
jgi:hypothetical protein